jgi:predicted nucleotidyltransferase
LSNILAKTVGLADVLKEALEPLRSRIVLAFVYGSIAASAERTGSDIDLMIVGELTLSEIAPVLRGLEPALARPINPTMITPQEFLRRVNKKDHFLTTVLANRPLFIIGGQHELADLTSGAATKNSPDEPTGNRRSARRG